MWRKIGRLLSLSLISASCTTYMISGANSQTKYTKADKKNFVKQAWEDSGKNIAQAIKQYEQRN